MKKLNITKEQFNKSRYFTKKYGKLEYVSESGRLFKTNKGKVLMFKEGKLNSDFDDDLDDDYYDGGHLDADEDNPKFSIGDKVIWNDSLWKVVDCWYDSIEGSNLYDLIGLDTGEETSDVPGDELCAHDGGIAYESTKKFGRKFVKESSVRKCTNELIDYAEAYPKFWETIAKASLAYMSEDEVENMARMNDLLD